MSSTPIDPALAAIEDAFWQGMVEDFLSHHAPAAMTAALRDMLGNLVRGFFATNQGIMMQGLVVALDARYGLNGVLDEALLNAVRVNVANYPAAAAPLPSAPAMPPAPAPAPPTLPPPMLSAPTTAPTPGRPKKFPLEHRQRDWLYACDLCGHLEIERGELSRHGRIGAARFGFRIIREEIDHSAGEGRWFGVDKSCNEFTGRIMKRVGGNVMRAGRRRKAETAGLPCGPRITAAKKSTRLLREEKKSEEAKKLARKRRGEKRRNAQEEKNQEQDQDKDAEESDSRRG